MYFNDKFFKYVHLNMVILRLNLLKCISKSDKKFFKSLQKSGFAVRGGERYGPVYSFKFFLVLGAIYNIPILVK